MHDRQTYAFRRTQALVSMSRDLCAQTALAVRHGHEAITRTSALLAVPQPSSFLTPAPWRAYR